MDLPGIWQEIEREVESVPDKSFGDPRYRALAWDADEPRGHSIFHCIEGVVKQENAACCWRGWWITWLASRRDRVVSSVEGENRVGRRTTAQIKRARIDLAA